MTAIAVTEPEAVGVRTHADNVIPPRRGVPQGNPVAAANFDKRIKPTWNRDGTQTPVGWTADAWVRDASGEIEISQRKAYTLLDEPGTTLVTATREKLLAGVGERGPNRRFSLRFSFARFGDGR